MTIGKILFGWFVAIVVVILLSLGGCARGPERECLQGHKERLCMCQCPAAFMPITSWVDSFVCDRYADGGQ